MPKLHGLNIALTTPFSVTGVDTQALRQHILALNKFAQGYVIGGTTGESWSISDIELQQLLTATREVSEGRSIIAGFWRENCQELINTTLAIQDFCDFLLIPLPTELFHASEEHIIAFYSKLAGMVNKPILLYNFPSRCDGRAISTQLAIKLAQENSNIIGVKDSSSDAQLTKDIITQQIPLQPILGSDSSLYECLELMHQHCPNDAMASISGASSVPSIAAIESQIYANHQAQPPIAKQQQAFLVHNYFTQWKEMASLYGGQAPIIKGLVAKEIAEYPLDVRAPLKKLTLRNSTV